MRNIIINTHNSNVNVPSKYGLGLYLSSVYFSSELLPGSKSIYECNIKYYFYN
jgi:hypothetical protein